MKKILATTVALIAAAALLAGCGAKAEKKTAAVEKKTYLLKYAELNPNNHIMDNCADEFARLVKEKSGGRITIDVFPAGQLGDEKTAYQTLQMGGGAIDIARGNTNSLGDFGAKKLTLFGLPFTFRDREHLWKVLNSEIGQSYLKEMQEINSGMVGLFYLDEGARNFFTGNKKPIKAFADFKGKKLRVPTTNLMSDTVAALGAQSTPISFSELYSALQTGAVDGAEQPHSGYASNKFYEVAPNYLLTGHTYSPSIVLMSAKVWDALDDEAKSIIMAAGKETENWNKSNIEKLDAELLEQIKKAGANVIEVKDKTPYIEALKPIVPKYSAGLEADYQAILAK